MEAVRKEEIRSNVNLMMLEYAVYEVWNEFEMTGMISKYETIYFIQSCLVRTEDVQSDLHKNYRLFLTLISHISNGHNIDLLYNKQSKTEIITVLEKALDTLLLIAKSYPDLATRFEQVTAIMKAQAVFSCCRAGDWNTALVVYDRLRINSFQKEYPHSLLHKRLACEVQYTLNSSSLKNANFPGPDYSTFIKLDVIPVLQEIYQTFPEPALIQHARHPLINQQNKYFAKEEVHHYVKTMPSGRVTVPFVVLEKLPDISGSINIGVDHKMVSSTYTSSQTNKLIEQSKEGTGYQTSFSSSKEIGISTKVYVDEYIKVTKHMESSMEHEKQDSGQNVSDSKGKKKLNFSNKFSSKSRNSLRIQATAAKKRAILGSKYYSEKMRKIRTVWTKQEELNIVEAVVCKGMLGDWEAVRMTYKMNRTSRDIYAKWYQLRKLRPRVYCKLKKEVLCKNKSKRVMSSEILNIGKSSSLDATTVERVSNIQNNQHKPAPVSTTKLQVYGSNDDEKNYPSGVTDDRSKRVSTEDRDRPSHKNGRNLDIAMKWSRWTEEEEIILIGTIMKNGTANWKNVLEKSKLNRPLNNIRSKWNYIQTFPKRLERLKRLAEKHVYKKSNIVLKELNNDHQMSTQGSYVADIDAENYYKELQLRFESGDSNYLNQGVDEIDTVKKEDVESSPDHDKQMQKGLRYWTREEELQLVDAVVQKKLLGQWAKINSICQFKRSSSASIATKWNQISSRPNLLESLKAELKQNVSIVKTELANVEASQSDNFGEKTDQSDKSSSELPLSENRENTITGKIQTKPPQQLWTKEEELKLADAVLTRGMKGKWKSLSEEIGFERSAKDYCQKWFQISKNQTRLNKIKKLLSEQKGEIKVPDITDAEMFPSKTDYFLKEDDAPNEDDDETSEKCIEPDSTTQEYTSNHSEHETCRKRWSPDKNSKEQNFMVENRNTDYDYQDVCSSSQSMKENPEVDSLLHGDTSRTSHNPYKKLYSSIRRKRKNWTEEEEMNLVKAVRCDHMIGNWKETMSTYGFDRSPIDIHNKWKTMSLNVTKVKELEDKIVEILKGEKQQGWLYLLENSLTKDESEKTKTSPKSHQVNGKAIRKFPRLAESVEESHHSFDYNIGLGLFLSGRDESKTESSKTKVFVSCGSYRFKRPIVPWTEDEELKLVEAMDHTELRNHWEKIRKHFKLKKTQNDIHLKWTDLTNSQLRLAYLKKKVATLQTRKTDYGMQVHDSAEYYFSLDEDAWNDSIQDMELDVFIDNGNVLRHGQTSPHGSTSDASDEIEVLHESCNFDTTGDIILDDIIVDNVKLYNPSPSVSSEFIYRSSPVEEITLSDDDDTMESSSEREFYFNKLQGLPEPHKLQRIKTRPSSKDIFSRKLSSKKLLKKLGIVTPF